MTWSDLKEAFYAIGAVAGLVALLRPVAESKFQRDQERYAGIRKLVDELQLIALASRIDNQRQVADRGFDPFRTLAYDRRHGHDSLRFSGPLAKYFLREVDAMIAAYEGLRERRPHEAGHLWPAAGVAGSHCRLPAKGVLPRG